MSPSNVPCLIVEGNIFEILCLFTRCEFTKGPAKVVTYGQFEQNVIKPLMAGQIGLYYYLYNKKFKKSFAALCYD